jgi:hypothetical protein
MPKRLKRVLPTGIYLSYLGIDTCVTGHVLEAAYDSSPVLPSHSTAVSRAGGYRLLKLSSNNLVTKNVCKPLKENPTQLLLGILKSVLRKH